MNIAILQKSSINSLVLNKLNGLLRKRVTSKLFESSVPSRNASRLCSVENSCKRSVRNLALNKCSSFYTVSGSRLLVERNSPQVILSR